MTNTRDSETEALKLAVEQARREPKRARQLDAMLKNDGWRATATFASYHRQMQSLRLKPWETPPCWIADPFDPPNFGEERPDTAGDGRAKAAELCRQMIELGISCFHPDPAAAIAEAEGRRRNKVPA